MRATRPAFVYLSLSYKYATNATTTFARVNPGWTSMTDGTSLTHYHIFDGTWQPVDGQVIEEIFVSIHVNGQELATIAATPIRQDWLAVGFLANEGFITSKDELRAVHICPSGLCVDVWLTHGIEPPPRRIVTSGAVEA